MNLCLYTPEQEENIFIRKRAQTWQRSGLLSEDQLAIIDKRTSTYLTETALFFRILYFIFTWLSLSATVGLLTWLLDIRDERAFGLTFFICAIPTYGLAEYLVQRYHFYRHGIEEALVLASLGLFWLGIVLMSPDKLWHHGYRPIIAVDAVLACLFSYWLYSRFRFLYTALISTVALCAVPFQFSLSPLWERILLVLILGLLFLTSLKTETDNLEDFRKKRKGIIQACLFAGIYLSINLRIFAVAESWLDQTPPHLTSYAGLTPEAYWISYVLTFLVPTAGLYFAIKARKRALLNVAGIALVLSLATNKDYLGLVHYAWDPIILGATLILAAVLIIRWLTAGQNKERYGFTAESILKPERYGLSLPEIGAAVLPGVTAAGETTAAEPSPFEGGQSGGGGASRNF
ncbi:MAG: hypothetical protein JW902_00535 [Syntrophaceae bacterium]|nr:hypothetical protein [Syntrophaceae bacterium]